MHQLTRNEGNLVTVRVSEKLTKGDYETLIPAWQRLLEEKGLLRMLFVMEDFHGWELGAAWDDFRFDVRRASEVERVAMVGEKRWQEWLAKIGEVFMPERVRYFDLADLAKAERWVWTE
jgi:glutathionylspermidine synthase